MDRQYFRDSFATPENYKSRRYDFTHVLVDLDGSIK